MSSESQLTRSRDIDPRKWTTFYGTAVEPRREYLPDVVFLAFRPSLLEMERDILLRREAIAELNG